MTIALLTICLTITIIVLFRLTVIDLKIRLLPNIYVAAFAVLAVLFHFITNLHYTTPLDAGLGALSGGLMLYAIRFIANHHYKRDTLGLGDVKLIAAAGLWLGLSHIFLAISIGAFAGLLHGALYAAYIKHKHNTAISFTQLEIPAGPGFIFGIVIVGIYKFHDLFHIVF